MRRSFFLIVWLLSCVLHAYVAWRLLPSLQLSAVVFALVATLLGASALLTPAPMLLRLAHLPPRWADGLAWVGYLLMGWFASLFVLTFLRDLALGLVALVAALTDVHVPSAWTSQSAWGVLIAALALTLLGVWNARRIARVVTVEVPLPALPQALHGFTIVQLSDVHVGPTIQRDYLAAIVRRVNELKSDVVAITGDLVDGAFERYHPHLQPLADLRSRHGTVCITGNHEYYHGVHAWLDAWRALGMRVLLNEHVVLDHEGARVLIAGVTDYSAHRFDLAHRSDPVAALGEARDAAIKVLLAHQPRSVFAAEQAGFDLQLSGHTHGGQFWPWNLFVPLQQPFVAGLKRVGNLMLYVSRGTGYWGPPVRFGAPSEITRLRLVAAK